MSTKAEAREACRLREQGLSAEERRIQDAAMLNRILTLPAFQTAEKILLFCSVGAEPATDALLRACLEMGKQTAVPVITGPGEMQAGRLLSMNELIPGKYGIPTVAKTNPVLWPEQLDAILVPGAAFDRSGFRLGRGGGFYDRFLPKTPAVRIGVIRSLNLLDTVPAEEHDCRMHYIITEKETLEIV